MTCNGCKLKYTYIQTYIYAHMQTYILIFMYKNNIQKCIHTIMQSYKIDLIIFEVFRYYVLHINKKRDRHYNTNSVTYYMSLYKMYHAKKEDVERFA